MYDDNFYDKTEHPEAVSKLVDHLLTIINPLTVLDVGCGRGLWLKELEKRGVSVRGIDGDWINHETLLIDTSDFIVCDIEDGFVLPNRFDLTISLEVAEHLKKESADIFVESLVMSSDKILFSAALPKQKGVNHINCQPISYWAEKFNKHGYFLFDCFRPKFLTDKTIPSFYRTNIYMFMEVV